MLFVAVLAAGALLPLPAAPAGSTARVGAWTTAQVVLVGVVAFGAGRWLVGGHPPATATAFLIVTNTLAAVAEEAWFRRLCFGLLAPAGAGFAVVGSTVLFAAVHVSIYGYWVLPARSRRRAAPRVAALGHRFVGRTGDHPRRREPPGGALTVRRRSLVLGAIVVGAYLVVLAVTVGLRDDHVRPLYDGFTPPPSYRWVDPPSFFSSGNVEPKPAVTTIRLGTATDPRRPASRPPTASSSSTWAAAPSRTARAPAR